MHAISAGGGGREAGQGNTSLLLGRILVGAGQGILLYWLFRELAARTLLAQSPFFGPLVLVSLLIPPVVTLGFAQLRASRLTVWCVALGAVVAWLAWHSAWRLAGPGQDAGPPVDIPGAWALVFPGATAWFYASVFVFISYALIVAGESAGTWFAPYPAYFRTGWKLGLQIHLAALFAVVLYLVLWLGAGLFLLLQLKFLGELLREAWFNIPVLTIAFAVGLHITDVRDDFIRGLRTLVLTLLSWILPLLVLIVTGFLLSLLVKGLAPLWATRWAASLLLGVAAVQIVLINAVYKSGLGEGPLPRVLRRATYVGCLTLAPLVAIAGYALALRIGQYGLSDRRVLVAAALIVAGCYAVGYAWAALERHGSLRRIAPTNVLTAWVTLAVLVAVFTPVADPARLSVWNQVARLKAGKVSPEQFDFQYLQLRAARYGREALASLRADTSGPNAAAIRERIEAVTQKRAAGKIVPPAAPLDAAAIGKNLTVRTTGRALPATFVSNDWRSGNAQGGLPDCLRSAGERCDAYIVDLAPERGPAVMLMKASTRFGVLLEADEAGLWRVTANFYMPRGCEAMMGEALAQGSYRATAPAMPDLAINGRRLRLQPTDRAETPCTP